MKNTSQAFVNQIVGCLLVTICFGGSIGLGTVWMRHQISLTADANRALAARIAECERYLAETKTLIESAQSPEELRRLNADFRLGLVPVNDGQVMRFSEDAAIRRMVARGNREIFGDAPATVALPLALNR